MVLEKKPFVKTAECLIIILLLLLSFLFSGVLPLQNENSQASLITSVSASRNFSSYTPRSFRSDSGQTHLLFLHRTQESDQLGHNFYHTYELEDRSWTVPFSLEGGHEGSHIKLMVISLGESSENDFSVYYNKDGELFKKAYNGQSHQWSDSEKLFSKLDIHDYLHFPTSSDPNLLRFYIHSFSCLNEGTFNVVWSFYSRNTSLFSHESERHYLISKVFSNGTIKSQVIQFTEYVFYNHHTSLNFVSRNASLMLYSPEYIFRSILLQNGSWSSWQLSGLSRGLHNLYGVMRGKSTQQLIHNQYLVSSHRDKFANIKWGLADLTVTNLSVHPIQLPHKADPWEKSIRTTFKLRESNNGSPVFMTAFITNKSIELWTYNLLNNTWIQISQLDYTQTKISVYSGEPKVFNIDLLADGPNWRVFWNQQIKTGNFLHEIFTVSYNTETGNWSQVTQITDTHDITDDFVGGTPGFSIFILFLGLLISILLRRGKGTDFQFR